MQTKVLKWIVLAVACLGAPLARAQLLSIDINNTSRGDNTAPGFTAWNMATDLSSSPQQVTRAFVNAASNLISCTVTKTVPPVSDSTTILKADWGNKDGTTTSPDPSVGYRLSSDGVWVYNTNVGQPYTNGGALSLTISNLSAGPHTITTYHNDVWGTHVNTSWHSNNVVSRCIISVGGVPIFTNTPTFYATNDSKCGFAFFWITNAFDGQPVVINFDPDHSSVLDFVILNGFEIDRPYAPGTTATALFPSPGDEHVFANNDMPNPGTAGSGYLTLGWQPAGFAISNYVYLGISSNAVAAATTASPEFKTASGVTAGTNNYDVTNLDSKLTYYWRVDQLDVENGATNLAKGFVWLFRTRHLAFPTVEGYGRFGRGGRGGVVMEVTNLLDYDSNETVIPGSYRAAIEATGPRTVVFRVSGLIRLKRPCTINSANGYLTIAGQTAPGDGICLCNWRAGISSCSDVVIRFVRCRLGDASQQAMDGIGLGNSTHSVIDHCSISWTIDEATSSRQSGAVNSSSAMITFQRNIVSEPLQHSYHYNDTLRAQTGCTNCYQEHAFAASISGEIGSYHHNLIAHSTDRNWSLAGGLDQSSHYAGSLDIRNNVVYNWVNRTTDGGVARCNYESNYYKPYPPNARVNYLLKLDPLNTNWGTEAYYMVGNVMEGTTYYNSNWMTGSFNDNGGTAPAASVRTNSEIFPSYVTTQTASNAYKIVLSDVGANRPVVDVIDLRIIQEVLNRTTHYEGTNGGTNYIINGVLQTNSGPNYPGIIDKPSDVHDAVGSPNFPWPAYATYNVWPDSDHDGLPDWWEVLHHTNPNSAPGDFSDSNADPDGDGYTNLEDYLNWLAGIHALCSQNSYVDLDLSVYAAGLHNPVYAVSALTNGTVALMADGHTARFTPSNNFAGEGRFQFVANDGLALTNAVSVMVLALPPTIITPPADQNVIIGSTPNFTVGASGAAPLSYAWAFNGTNLPGATNATLSLPNVQSNQAGLYSVMVTNAYGSTGAVARLTIYPRPPASAWGDDSFGQSDVPALLTNGVAIAGGAYHSLAVRADGSVLAWGDNNNGQCNVPANLTNAVVVAAGGYHSLALRADGSVIAWGDDSAGQIDFPAAATNVVAIAAGLWHSLALRADGAIVAWGDDDSGQVKVPANATNIVAISAGAQHSLALRADGTVLAWGSDLGPSGLYAGQADVPSALSQVVAIAAGDYHSLALQASGAVVGWGDDSSGQTEIPQGLTNAVAIAAGGSHSLALQTGGKVLAWGDDSSGQSDVDPALAGVWAVAAGGYHSLALVGPGRAAPAVAATSRQGQRFIISVSSVRGRAYFLLSRNSLDAPGWTLLTGVAGDGGVKPLTDPAANVPYRFYRVRQQ